MQPGEELDADIPMTRYRCCKHCASNACPRFDGHIGSCPVPNCTQGNEMFGAPTTPKVRLPDDVIYNL